MCLHNLYKNFSMEWNSKEKDFVGFGYKKYNSYYLTNDKPNSEGNSVKLSTVWREAQADHYGKKSKQSIESTDTGTPYWPGFHIFLKKEDAQKYWGDVVVKVMFKGLIGIGTNETNAYYDTKYGACVIARYMKFIEVVK